MYFFNSNNLLFLDSLLIYVILSEFKEAAHNDNDKVPPWLFYDSSKELLTKGCYIINFIIFLPTTNAPILFGPYIL